MKRNCFKYAGSLLLAVLFFMMPEGKNLPDLEMGLKAVAGKTKNECQLVLPQTQTLHSARILVFVTLTGAF